MSNIAKLIDAVFGKKPTIRRHNGVYDWPIEPHIEELPSLMGESVEVGGVIPGGAKICEANEVTPCPVCRDAAHSGTHVIAEYPAGNGWVLRDIVICGRTFTGA